MRKYNHETDEQARDCPICQLTERIFGSYLQMDADTLRVALSLVR